MAGQDDQNKEPETGAQKQASFSTGSTTQGGSNFGQGSSHLGGETYQQGSVSNKGANYDNETDKLGSSTTGTNAEGSSSPGAGGGMTEQPEGTADKNDLQQTGSEWNGEEDRNDPRRGNMEDDDAKKLFEGDRRDTSLEQSSGLGDQQKDQKDNDGGAARGWSNSTLNENKNK